MEGGEMKLQGLSFGVCGPSPDPADLVVSERKGETGLNHRAAGTDGQGGVVVGVKADPTR